VQRRLLHGLGRIEFTDVGAARESLASAGDDDGLDGGIVQRTGHAFDDAKPGAVTQAVDRGIVERDDGYAVLNLILRCHAGSFGVKSCLGIRILEFIFYCKARPAAAGDCCGR
jgi:hypothetical protein